ncbi:MAG: hypothetical protein GEU98_18845 [Pseudonocardiaceae bacterium]|nr:hypothetical protein [Pseudonocardiaceae bacterium]
MASNNATTTESKPEGEQEETPDPEQPQGPSSSEAGGEDQAAENETASETSDEGADTAKDSAGGFVGGAAAVISAGLGLSSLTGTSVGEMLRSREELIGQIEAGTGGGGDQIEAFYGAPWNATALVNGIFALIAVVIGGVLLAVLIPRANSTPWVKAVALSGVVLGVIGLLLAGGMHFDLFANPPELPAGPAAGPGG